jgi:FPC/CPF motif-containing protein YcgG
MQNIRLDTQLLDKVLGDAFPCIMAKNVIAGGNAHVIKCSSMVENSQLITNEILLKIYSAIEEIKQSKGGYHSMIIEFDNLISCEQQFETYMWNFLQKLHDIDRLKYDWDSAVSSDPHSVGFSFSLMSEAFYIIGMHPKSSRKARIANKPTLIFNLHSQFEKLRELGAYQNLKDKVRARDVSYSGSINPMLDDFGASSEATQYSGRYFDKKKWKCPFQPRP